MKRAWLAAFFCLLQSSVFGGEIFRVAAYNVENYVEDPASARPIKSPQARAKVRESILALKPDVIALEEIGGSNELFELQSALKAGGLDLPNWDYVQGHDTNIHVAVLSRFRITARHPHTNETFLLDGRRMTVSRGFAEDEIQVNDKYKFTLMAAHLKSRRTSTIADEADWRLEEARILRRIIDARLAADPGCNLVVLGDFNDVKDSKPVRTLIGRGKNALFDTRPAEQNGDTQSERRITWTHYYGKEDDYSRIDYILLNHRMRSEWLEKETRVLNLPDWGVASDHRPLVAGFVAEER